MSWISKTVYVELNDIFEFLKKNPITVFQYPQNAPKGVDHW